MDEEGANTPRDSFTEPKDAKLLPKTGIPEIDAEGVVVQLCLTRIADHSAKSGLGGKKWEKGVNSVIASPEGKTVDVSRRTKMGREPPKEISDAELMPERTDAMVAESALLRLLKFASRTMDQHDTLLAANKVMQSSTDSLMSRIRQLEEENSSLTEEVNNYRVPGAAFQQYKKSWEEQHSNAQQVITETTATKKELIDELMQKRAELRRSKKHVKARKALFDVTEATLEQEFAADEADIARVLEVFQPKPTVVLGGLADNESPPASTAADMGTDAVSSAGIGSDGLNSQEASTRSAVPPQPIVKQVDSLPNFDLLKPATSNERPRRRSISPRTSVVGSPEVSMRSSSLNNGSLGASPKFMSPPPGTLVTFPEMGEGLGNPLNTSVGRVSSPTSPKLVMTATPNVSPSKTDLPRRPVNRAASLDVDHLLGASASRRSSNDPSPRPGEVPEEAQALLHNIHGMDITSVMDSMGKVLEDDPEDRKRRRKSEKEKKAAGSKELVITRHISTGARYIRMQDSSNTLIGTIMAVFLHSPTTYALLQIMMESTVGRKEMLARQARNFKVEALWDEILGYERPEIGIMECLLPTTDAVSEPFLRGDGIRTLSGVDRDPFGDPLSPNDDDSLTDAEKNDQKRRMERMLRFKRLDDKADEFHARHYVPGKPHDDDVQSVVMKQHPGLVDLISRDFGMSTDRKAPIWTRQVRCYASSMVAAAAVDNIIKPFVDSRAPYFSTDDEPGSFISVHFNSMYIIPTGYSFASVHPITGGHFPRHWRLEGSVDDGTTWVTLRKHVNDDTLNRYRPTYFFDVQPPRSQVYFNAFRIVQEGPNAMGNHHLCVSSVEIYGRIIFAKRNERTDGLLLPTRSLRPMEMVPTSDMPEDKPPALKAKGKGGAKRRSTIKR